MKKNKSIIAVLSAATLLLSFVACSSPSGGGSSSGDSTGGGGTNSDTEIENNKPSSGTQTSKESETDKENKDNPETDTGTQTETDKENKDNPGTDTGTQTDTEIKPNTDTENSIEDLSFIEPLFPETDTTITVFPFSNKIPDGKWKYQELKTQNKGLHVVYYELTISDNGKNLVITKGLTYYEGYVNSTSQKELKMVASSMKSFIHMIFTKTNAEKTKYYDGQNAATRLMKVGDVPVTEVEESTSDVPVTEVEESTIIKNPVTLEFKNVAFEDGAYYTEDKKTGENSGENFWTLKLEGNTWEFYLHRKTGYYGSQNFYSDYAYYKGTFIIDVNTIKLTQTHYGNPLSGDVTTGWTELNSPKKNWKTATFEESKLSVTFDESELDYNVATQQPFFKI